MTRTRQAPRKNRRYIAVFATLAVFAGLVAVTQVSLAGSRRGHNNGNNLPVCPPSAAAPASHDHSDEQDPDATPPPGAPPGEVAGAAGDGTSGAAPDAEAPAADAEAPAADAEAPAADAEAPAADAEAPAADAEAPAADADAPAADAPAAQAQRQQNNDRRRCRPASTPTSSNGGSNGGGTGGTPSTGTSDGATTSPTTPTAPAPLEPLGDTCENSDLPEHDGFQGGPKCVTTQMGEVAAEGDNPTLLISQAPARVRVNQPFELRVSTRNLVRDRFLGAAAGGYYLESSFLTEENLVRGHFHVACRLLSGRNAQEAAPVPAFFKAVEDGGGGRAPDTVTVAVPGLAATGVAQCAAWAGDGSHRIPMMARANQIPAFDSVRVVVGR